jgi:hypothetical protein
MQVSQCGEGQSPSAVVKVKEQVPVSPISVDMGDADY